MQYIIATHLFNKSFIYFLMVQDIFSLNEASTAQYLIFDRYVETVFQAILELILQ